jgi:hypothetical protein
VRRYKFQGPCVPKQRVGGDLPKNSETRSGNGIGLTIVQKWMVKIKRALTLHAMLLLAQGAVVCSHC